MQMLEFVKPEFQLPKEEDIGTISEEGWLIFDIRTRQWGYWGNDVSGHQYEDTIFKLSPEKELLEISKSYNRFLFGPDDAGPNVLKRTILWSLGRFFSKIIDEVTNVEKLNDGRIIVSAIGKKSKTESASGRWELVIEPTAAWIVREARFYKDVKPDVIACEMENSGTTWIGSYCIPHKALFNYDSSIENKQDFYFNEIVFNQDIEQFDDKVYQEAYHAVKENNPPKLIIHDMRI